MKVIDLLNKIANGEEVPKKIKLNEVIFEYQGDDYLYKDEDKKEYWLFSSGYTDKYAWLENFLIAEVEILEEPKGIPEKIDLDELYGVDYNDEKYIFAEKINKIIDYLESKDGINDKRMVL